MALTVQVSGTSVSSVLSPYIDHTLIQALTPTNTLSASFPKAYTCPRHVTYVPERKTLIVPCENIHSSLPGQQESLTISWIISPSIPGVWINITVLELRAVFSRPRCKEQYLKLKSLNSIPKQRWFCGILPQFTMLYSKKATVVLFSNNLKQPTLTFSYQFIQRPEYEVVSLEPKTVYMSKRCRLRPEVHEDPYISVKLLPLLMKTVENEKRSIHFIPDITFLAPYQVSIWVSSCHVTVYEGPGILSPILYDRSVPHAQSSVPHGSGPSSSLVWSEYTYLQLCIAFTCKNNHHSDYLRYHNIDNELARNFSQSFLYSPQHENLKDVMHCENQLIQPIKVSSGQFAVRVLSHPHKNTWCIIHTPPNIIFVTGVEMQYFGPSHLYLHHQSLACQLGGVFMFSDINGHHFVHHFVHHFALLLITQGKYLTCWQ